MELNDRKKKILQAIIDDYILTAEPVGSSYVLASHNLGVSSATVRNEMAALEEAGYLEKPHTSAGRVPSVLGYRVYVNELMNKYKLTSNEINQIRFALHQKYMELGKAMTGISELMSILTQYTTALTKPTSVSAVIGSVKLIAIDKRTFVMIVVTKDGEVKSSNIITSKPYDAEVLEKLSNLLNLKLDGVSVSTLTDEVLESEKQLLPVESSLLDPIFDFLKKLSIDTSQPDIEFNGTSNIFNHPEFNSIERAKDFFEFLRHDDGLKKIISGTGNNTSVIIGGENPVLKDHGLSLVVSNYSLGSNLKGKLAIIGPTRMDYSKVISTLDYLTHTLNDLSKNGDVF